MSDGSGNKISQKDPSVKNVLQLNPVLTEISVRLLRDCRDVIDEFVMQITMPLTC